MTAPSRSSDCHALVPCAGTGSRAGSCVPKQYVEVAGRAVVAHTLAALQSVAQIRMVGVVLAPADRWFANAVPAFTGHAWPVGGATRADSVLNGLQALWQHGAHEQDWVLVHDAARCLLDAQAVRELILACQDDEVGGLLAWPVADTLHRADGQRVASQVDRSGLWQAQTPQMFRLGALREALLALRAQGREVTDEASAMAAMGRHARLVQGRMDNFKITYPSDFELAARLLADRHAGSAVLD